MSGPRRDRGIWHHFERRKVDRWFTRKGLTFAGGPPDETRPVGTDTLPRIKHIVVLMMENHSYDNYLGTLAGRGDGLQDGEAVALAAQKTADGSTIAPYHLVDTVQQHGVPTQSWHATHLQWNGGALDGFARSVEVTEPGRDPRPVMGHWDGSDLPFYHGLASTFPLADRWFCSCLGPTFPNRRFLIAGTAHGLIDDLPFAMVDYPEAGTIFDQLTTHGISWVDYHRVSKAKVVLKRALGVNSLLAARAAALATCKWLPPLVKAVQGNMQLTADLYPMGMARCMAHLRSTEQFWTDVDRGDLPAVSIVDPDFGSYSEEDPQDVRMGESFAAEVINRVMHGPAWPDTLLIWLYDEHGGYFDHVAPPAAPPPDDIEAHSVLGIPKALTRILRPLLRKQLAEIEAIDTVDPAATGYDHLGFRVPAVIVSPLARPDFVSHEVYDHTSILKLIERKWNLPPMTRRDAAAADPLEALDLDGPPAFLTPPTLPAPARAWGSF